MCTAAPSSGFMHVQAFARQPARPCGVNDWGMSVVNATPSNRHAHQHLLKQLKPRWKLLAVIHRIFSQCRLQIEA
uniref:Uncharacterized protein n=1 Tax=Ditylenchus dipsaci TaxID=166011 RepID=A0A915CVY2_9BILA